MSAVTETTLDAAAGDRLARRNAMILAVAQALAGGNNVVLIATGAIVGAMLAPDRSLATVPVSIYVVGMWMGALPRGWIARRYGRRTSFFVGTAFGVLAGLLNCAAVVTASFTLLCIGALCTGFYAAVHQSYRFAAADTASDAFRPKAISWVMVGGIFAGLFGSQLVIATKDLWQPYLFAGTVHRPVGGGAGLGGGSGAGQDPDAAGAHRGESRPTAFRDRAPAALHRGGGLRRRQLFDDEHGDDLGAARHGRLQSFDQRGGARHPVAYPRDVRAVAVHRLADPALRRRAYRRHRARSDRAERDHLAFPASRSGTSGSG